MAQEDTPQGDQEIKTLFGNHKLSHGGYGGLTFGMDKIDGTYAFHSGIRAAWMIGHSFGFGIVGSGFSNNLWEYPSEDEVFYSLSGGYGGFLFEPVFAPRFPIHLSFPIVLGAGGVANTKTYQYNHNDWDVFVEDEAFFLVAQPGVELEFNLFKFMRLGVGASYRMTTDIILDGKKKDLLNGFMGQCSLKFGKF
ncbi:MAG: hypothetical protein CVU05_04145 [Bacteroidetes bacterium HGW-Bacteroidetes-21]|nr:MAG: hypothetical protein CVU05_04145 [Bacteroidetes bacterium HGW-Bacteroidetes-21]